MTGSGFVVEFSPTGHPPFCQVGTTYDTLEDALFLAARGTEDAHSRRRARGDGRWDDAREFFGGGNQMTSKHAAHLAAVQRFFERLRAARTASREGRTS